MATTKQKLVVKKLMENNGNVSKSMKEAGYSLETAKNPQQVTRSKGFEELMEKELPDGLLLKRHKELLNKREVITTKFFNHTTGEYEKETKVIDEPDTKAVKAGLNMGYKLKGKYKPIGIDIREISLRIDV